MHPPQTSSDSPAPAIESGVDPSDTGHPTLARFWWDLICEHPSLSDASSQVAQELLTTLHADRVWLGMGTDDSWRVIHVAPGGTIDARSEMVRAIESLLAAVHRDGGEFQLCVGTESSSDVNPVIVQWIDVSAARQCHVLMGTPRRGNQRAAIVVERWQLQRDRLSSDRLQIQQAIPVIQYLVERETQFVRRRGSLIPSVLARHRPVGIALAACCLAALLIFLPVKFNLTVDGQIEPQVMQTVFAPRDSIVHRVDVTHGQRVVQGDPLVTVYDPDLQRQAAEVAGQIATLQSQLASMRANRSLAPGGNSAARSIEHQDLEVQIQGLRRQHDIITQAIEELSIHSPLDGEVQFLDVNHQLEGRPVSRGQPLLIVADSQGPWQLRLEISDDLAGYVIAAQSESPVPVSFRVRSHPNETLRGEIQHIASSTRYDVLGRRVVMAWAPVKERDRAGQNPVGAGAIATIHCGKRSLGFVWFREIIELIQRYC